MGRRANAYKYSKIGSAHIPKDNPIFLIAPTLQSHEIWCSRQEWEVGKIEGSSNTGARVELVARVDAMFLERMRQTHISPYLVYPAVGAVLHLTIDYTATSYSYSPLVNAHFPPQQYKRKMAQAAKVRETALHVLSWKEQRNTREQLDLKAERFHRGLESIYSVGEEGREGTVLVHACDVRACYRMRCGPVAGGELAQPTHATCIAMQRTIVIRRWCIQARPLARDLQVNYGHEYGYERNRKLQNPLHHSHNKAE